MTTHTHCDICNDIIDDQDIPREGIKIRVLDGVVTDLEDTDVCVDCTRQVGDSIAGLVSDES